MAPLFRHPALAGNTQVCIPPVAGSALEPALPTPSGGGTLFETPRWAVAPPHSSARPSRLPSRRFRHEPTWMMQA